MLRGRNMPRAARSVHFCFLPHIVLGAQPARANPAPSVMEVIWPASGVALPTGPGGSVTGANGAHAAPHGDASAAPTTTDNQVPAIVAAPAPDAGVPATSSPTGRFPSARPQLLDSTAPSPAAREFSDPQSPPAGHQTPRRAGSCAAVSSLNYPAAPNNEPGAAGDFRENPIPGQRPGVAHATALPGIPPARVIAARSSLGISHLRRAPGAPAHFARGKA